MKSVRGSEWLSRAVWVVGQGRSRAGLQGHGPLRWACSTTSQAAQTVTQPWVRERTQPLCRAGAPRRSRNGTNTPQALALNCSQWQTCMSLMGTPAPFSQFNTHRQTKCGKIIMLSYTKVIGGIYFQHQLISPWISYTLFC